MFRRSLRFGMARLDQEADRIDEPLDATIVTGVAPRRWDDIQPRCSNGLGVLSAIESRELLNQGWTMSSFSGVATSVSC